MVRDYCVGHFAATAKTCHENRRYSILDGFWISTSLESTFPGERRERYSRYRWWLLLAKAWSWRQHFLYRIGCVEPMDVERYVLCMWLVDPWPLPSRSPSFILTYSLVEWLRRISDDYFFFGELPKYLKAFIVHWRDTPIYAFVDSIFRWQGSLLLVKRIAKRIFRKSCKWIYMLQNYFLNNVRKCWKVTVSINKIRGNMMHRVWRQTDWKQNNVLCLRLFPILIGKIENWKESANHMITIEMWFITISL